MESAPFRPAQGPCPKIRPRECAAQLRMPLAPIIADNADKYPNPSGGLPVACACQTCETERPGTAIEAQSKSKAMCGSVRAGTVSPETLLFRECSHDGEAGEIRDDYLFREPHLGEDDAQFAR